MHIHEISYDRLDAAIIAHDRFSSETVEKVRDRQWAMVKAGTAEMDDAFVLSVEIELKS